MSAPDINFADPAVLRRRFLHSWTALLIGVSLALTAYAAWRWAETARAERIARAELQAAEAALAQRASLPPARANDVVAPERRQAANTAIQRLNVPWRDLLDAIEAATPTTIALVELSPDAPRGTLLGVAEARDLASMTSYVESLRTVGFFDQVTLVRHEMNPQATERPLRFHFEARWTSSTASSAGGAS